MNAPLLLKISHLRKTYGANCAVDDVSFDLKAGEVHALIGENGAGKSTFLGMLGGTIAPDAGTMGINNTEYDHLNPALARTLGIAVVYQELSLCPNLTVADNIYLGNVPTQWGFKVQRPRMRAGAQRALAVLGTQVSPDAPIRGLPPAEQQLVEIARAISGDLKILVLDEPTSSLTHDDFTRLRDVIRGLTPAGVGVIFVSHRLPEVLDLSDRVSVMRDGRLIATVPRDEVSANQLAALMVGSSGLPQVLSTTSRPDPAMDERPDMYVLQVRSACRAGQFRDISLFVKKGEVVGVAGLRGSGRHELADCLFGRDRLDAGEIILRGRRIKRMSPRRSRRVGIAYLPQNRKTEGIFAVWDAKRNLLVGNIAKASKWGVISYRQLRRWSLRVLQDMRVTPTDPDRPITSFSGGNQQKAILGRILASTPSLLILLEPTRGVDVGAKAEIIETIRYLAEVEGTGILLIDSELPELISLSDRIYVMHRGQMVGELDQEHATEAAITLLAAGSEGTRDAPVMQQQVVEGHVEHG